MKTMRVREKRVWMSWRVRRKKTTENREVERTTWKKNLIEH